MDLFTCNVLQSLHKDSCTMKDLKVAVGNKVPETFGKLLEIDGVINTEHIQLNRLIVQYLLGRVNDSLDSGAPTRKHVEQAPGMSIIRHMVDETSLDRSHTSLEEFKKPADDATCEPKSKITV